MTDAAHLLSDVSGFAVAIFAAWYAAQRSKTTHTFGYEHAACCNLYPEADEHACLHSFAAAQSCCAAPYFNA